MYYHKREAKWRPLTVWVCSAGGWGWIIKSSLVRRSRSHSPSPRQGPSQPRWCGFYSRHFLCDFQHGPLRCRLCIGPFLNHTGYITKCSMGFGVQYLLSMNRKYFQFSKSLKLTDGTVPFLFTLLIFDITKTTLWCVATVRKVWQPHQNDFLQ